MRIMIVRRVGGLLCELEHALYRLVIAPLVAFLPAPLAYRIACLRGDWRYRIDAHTRGVTIRNLAEVLGEHVSAQQREQVAVDYFRLRACEIVDLMRLRGSGRALARLMDIRGLEHLERALAAGHGAVLCTTHAGQFAGAYSLIGASGFPVTAVGNWPDTDDPSMSWLARILARFFYVGPLEHHRRPNIQPGRSGAMSAIQIAAVLRANEVIVVPIDAPIMDPCQLPRAAWVDFFGRQVRLLPGTVQVAKRTGAQVLTMVVERSDDWQHQVAHISPPIDIDGDPLAVFRSCMADLEAPLHRRPAEWAQWESRQVLTNLGLVPGEVKKLPVYWDRHPDRRFIKNLSAKQDQRDQRSDAPLYAERV